MNVLTSRTCSENGLSFELLVDGQPFGELVGGGNEGIPYWDVEDDLPYWPPHGEPRQPDVRIVSVCSCGEYGCGHTRCRIEKKEDSVLFCDFEGDVSDKDRRLVLEFARQNYDEVVLNIVNQANERKKADTERR